MDISALLTELERGEMEEAAGAVGNETAEAEAAAVATSPPAAAAAGAAATDAEPSSDKKLKGAKKKKKADKAEARGQNGAGVDADDDLATAPTQAQSPPLVAPMAETVTPPPPLQAAPLVHRARRRTRTSPRGWAKRNPTADRGGTTAMRRLRRRTSASWPRRRARRRKPPRGPAALRAVLRLTRWQIQLPAPEVPAPGGKVRKKILVGLPR